MGGNGSDGDGDGTRVTNEIQAPPSAPDAPTRVDTPQVAGSADPLAAAAAGPGERGRLRRRLRKLKAVRAKQEVELGTLVFDARKRINGSRPEVVDHRAGEAAEVARQVRDLQHAVDAHADTREVATGVAGSCQSCGTLLSTEDRFCPSCGTPTKPGRRRPVDEAPAQEPADGASAAPAMPPPTGAPQAPAMPTPARPLPANAPPGAPLPSPMPSAESASATTTESPALSQDMTESPALSQDTTESPALSQDTTESPAVQHATSPPPPPPPAGDAELAHVDRSAIPPPPPAA